MSANSNRLFGALAPAYLAGGYSPIPIVLAGKSPGWTANDDTESRLPDWQSHCDEPVTLEYISAVAGFDSGIGLACGYNGLIGIDVDVLHEGHSAWFEREIIARLGPTIKRVGRAPKFTLFYRAPVEIASQSASWKIGDLKYGIDVLARGRQSVSEGFHQTTGFRYQWFNGSPATVPVSALPPITQSDIAWLWTLCPADVRPSVATPRAPRVHGDTNAPIGPKSTDLAQGEVRAVVWLLENAPNNGIGWADWQRLAFAVRGVAGDAAEAAFFNWSMQHTEADADATRRMWRDAAKANGSLTFGTIQALLSKRQGVKVPPSIKFSAETATDNGITIDWDACFANLIAANNDESPKPGAAMPVAAASTSTEAKVSHPATEQPVLVATSPRQAPTLTIDQLREQVYQGSLSFLQNIMERRLQGRRALGFGEQPLHVNQIAREQVGSGKTRSTVDALKYYLQRVPILENGENIVWVAKNHKNATDVYNELVPTFRADVVYIEGVERLCGNEDKKPTIIDLSKRGLPFSNQCDGCPLFDTCRYQQQRKAVHQGKIIIIQLAHLNATPHTEIPGLGEGSGPLFCMILDESPVAEMVTKHAMALKDLMRPFKLKPGKVPDDATKKQREDAEALNQRRADDEAFLNTLQSTILAALRDTKIDRANDAQMCAHATPLRSAFEKLTFLVKSNRDTPLGNGAWITRKKVELATFERAVDVRTFNGTALPTPLQTPSAATLLVDEVRRIKGHFFGNVMGQARAEIAATGRIKAGKLRGADSHAMRRLDVLAAILDLIALSGDSQHDRVNMLLVDHHHGNKKRGKKVQRVVMPYTLPDFPQNLRDVPKLFLDATASTKLLPLLFGETIDNGKWRVTNGEATRPFGKTRKVMFGPFQASQLMREGKTDENRILRKGAIKSNGRDTLNGDIEEDENAPPLNFAGMNSKRVPAQVERALMWRIARHKAECNRDGRNFKPAIIGPKRFVQGLMSRAWADAFKWIDGPEGKEHAILWHGANAGSNKLATASLQITLSQLRPPIDDIEAVALAYATRFPSLNPTVTGRFERTAGSISNEHLIPAVGHADPFVNEVLTQACDAQSEQAYGRARLTNRTDANEACELEAWDCIPVSDVASTTWDEVTTFWTPSAADIFKERHGRPHANVDELLAEPDLFRMVAGDLSEAEKATARKRRKQAAWKSVARAKGKRCVSKVLPIVSRNERETNEEVVTITEINTKSTKSDISEEWTNCLYVSPSSILISSLSTPATVSLFVDETLPKPENDNPALSSKLTDDAFLQAVAYSEKNYGCRRASKMVQFLATNRHIKTTERTIERRLKKLDWN